MRLDPGQSLRQEGEEAAAGVRHRLAESRVFMLDLLASPGSGKTSLILATIDALRDEFNIAVVRGDSASKADAEKIEAQGIAVVHVDAGKPGRLDAAEVERAVEALDLDRLDLIVVENAGDPESLAVFDRGENLRAMIFSAPEGHDKPLEYPGALQAAEAVLLNKADTIAALDFDRERFERAVHRFNSLPPVFPLSATTGEGMEAWAEWLADRIRAIQ